MIWTLGLGRGRASRVLSSFGLRSENSGCGSNRIIERNRTKMKAVALNELSLLGDRAGGDVLVVFFAKQLIVLRDVVDL